LNQTVIISEYLRLSLWPRSLVVFYGWPIALTLRDVVPYALLIGALLVVTIVGLIRRPTFGFLGAWFFITLAPTSSVIAIATEVGAERRMYLPLLAIVVLVTIAADALLRRVARTTALTPAVGGAVALAAAAAALTTATMIRNREYASALTLARTVVERRPTAIAHHILGEQLILAGRADDAVTHLRDAVATGDSKAGYSLGLALANQGKTGEAVERLQAFVGTAGMRLVPRWLEPSIVDVVAARLAMGEAYLVERRPKEAAEQARAVLAVAPRHVEARRLMGAALFASERYDEASVYFRQYADVRPNESKAWVDLGLALIGLEKLDDAIAAFRRAVIVDPRNAGVRRLLAMALLDRGIIEEAVSQAREAVALAPGDGGNRDLLNQALAAAGAGSGPGRGRGETRPRSRLDSTLP
jgi:tetratricopeptide (TPR) repeat protein